MRPIPLFAILALSGASLLLADGQVPTASDEVLATPELAEPVEVISVKQDAIPVVLPSVVFGLDLVEDVTSLQPSDAEAYYGLLHHADSVSQAELWEAGRAFLQQRKQVSGEATFPDMLHHPEAFRGQPIALEGHLLQAVQYKAQPNDYGIEQLYEAALFTDDSVHHPLTVIFLEKPADLKLGAELTGSVGVAGYFLKMYTYPSNDHKTRKAPLILAKTITVFPTPEVKPIMPVPIAFGLIATVIVFVIIAVWIGIRKDRQRLTQRREKELSENLSNFDDL